MQKRSELNEETKHNDPIHQQEEKGKQKLRAFLDDDTTALRD
jgi:hypothetical protein